MNHSVLEMSRGVRRRLKGGRPPRIDIEGIKRWLASGLSPTEVACELGVSRGTVYKARAGMTGSA